MNMESKKQIQNASYKELENLLDNYVKAGDLDVVKYILTSKELQAKLDINIQDDAIIIKALEHNHLHIIEYVLTDEDLKKQFKDGYHEKIVDYNNLLTMACALNKLDVVKFLLTDSRIKNQVHFKDNHYKGFSWAMNFPEIRDWLIYDYQLKPDETMKDLINFDSSIKAKFDLRDLKNKMNDELKEKENNIIKVKI